MKISPETKKALQSGVKVTGYIATSVALGVIFSPEFKDMLSDYGFYTVYGGIINVALAILLKIIKEKYPDLLISKIS